MNIYFKNFGFYKIDIDYVKYLYSIDKEVFFYNAAEYDKKPYLGIVAQLGDYLYCIPLTSAKSKHLDWKNISESNYIIYENVICDELRENDIFKQIGDSGQYKKILSVLDIKKMIPIDESICSHIDFTQIPDKQYHILLEKEYNFLIPHKQGILDKAKALYSKQKQTSIIKPFYCNFSLLEKGLQDYYTDVR